MFPELQKFYLLGLEQSPLFQLLYCILFLQVRGFRHGRRSFFDHLLKTSGIVEKLCKDIGITESRYLIDAGLYHSIYGTDYFEHKTDITRELIASLIGQRAEQLVHFFCSLPDRNIQILQS